MMWWLALLNTLAALASVGFGIVALVKPSVIAPASDKTAPSRFYPAMYAGRAIPLGLAVGIAVWLTPTPTLLPLLLGVAVLAQIADIIIGATYRLPGMVAGAVFAVACHGFATFSLFSATPVRHGACCVPL